MSVVSFESPEAIEDAERFTRFAAGQGYTVQPEYGLLDVPQGLTIVNSTIAPYVERIYQSDGSEHIDDALVQTCVRLRGLGNRLGDIAAHTMFLTSFKMGGCITNERDVTRTTTDLVDYMTSDFPIRRDNIMATYHSAQPEQQAALLSAGVSGDNIRAVENNSDVWVDWQFGTPGPTGRGITMLLRGPNGAPEQIGNVIQIDRKLLREDGATEMLAKQFTEIGFGVERLRMCAEGKEDAFALNPYANVIVALEARSRVEDTPDPALVRGVSDVMVGLHAMIERGMLPGPKSSGSVVRKLTRHLFIAAQDLAIPHEAIIDLFPSEKTSQVVASEFQKFEAIIKSAARLVPRYLQKHPDAERSKMFADLHGTHGIPQDVVELHLANNA